VSQTSEYHPQDRIAGLEKAAVRAGKAAAESEKMAAASADSTLQIGIESNAKYFANQSAEHNKWSLAWLCGTAALSLSTASRARISVTSTNYHALSVATPHPVAGPTAARCMEHKQRLRHCIALRRDAIRKPF
jgi:hypothetical protein